MSITPGIIVNGIHISAEQINAEVQYHPANSLAEAKYNAMQALVIKELLLQKAIDAGIYNLETSTMKPDDVIDEVLKKNIKVPKPDEETCQRYYNQNKTRFYTSPLFEVSHILFLAPPDNKEDYEASYKGAAEIIEVLKKDTTAFSSMAKKHSKCSSAADGGRLGQISKGQTMPAFEQALLRMEAGQMSMSPVASEVGHHVIQVHHRAEGEQLPYESVKEWIAEFLEQQSWQIAFHQYIQILAGESKISGFRLKQADSPLVQ